MKKKWKSLIAILIIAAITLTGCGAGGSKEEKKNDAQGTASTEEKTPLRDGKMTELRVVFPGNASSPASLEAVQEGINKILAGYMDATVKLDIQEWGVFIDQQSLMLSSGEDVALMFTFSGTKNYAANGQAKDITDLCNTYAADGLKLTSQYIDACKVNNKIYGFPTFHEYSSRKGLVCRTDILEELGIDPAQVKTWDDVEAVFKQVMQKHPEMNVLCPADASAGVFGNMISSKYDELTGGVVTLIDSDGKTVVNLYDTDMYRDFAKMAYEWNAKGYAMPDATTATETRQELLAAGNTFGYIGLIHPGTATQELKNSGVKVTTISIEEPILITNTVNFAQYMVPSSCSTPEKAVKLLDLMITNKDINNLMMYGIEGTDYVVKDEAKNIIGYPDGVDSSSSGWSNETWLVGNGSLGYIWESDPPTIWEQYKELNESAAPSPLFGFSYDTEKVKTEITAVTNVISKYRLVIQAGYADPDKTVASMVSELQAAGIQKIVDDAQAQVDQWYSSK